MDGECAAVSCSQCLRKGHWIPEVMQCEQRHTLFARLRGDMRELMETCVLPSATTHRLHAAQQSVREAEAAASISVGEQDIVVGPGASQDVQHFFRVRVPPPASPDGQDLMRVRIPMGTERIQRDDRFRRLIENLDDDENIGNPVLSVATGPVTFAAS
jgi:hypothetical protein